jgi:hypothetical protein
MRTKQTTTAGQRLALIIAALIAVVLLADVALGLILGSIGFPTNWLAGIVYTALAVQIIRRFPLHAVGWLFMAVGFFASVMSAFAILDGLESQISSEVVNGLVDWVGHLAYLPIYFIPMTLVLQFFPDGHLPSRRWWPVTATSILTLLAFWVFNGLSPWPIESGGILDTYNPLAIPGAEPILAVIGAISAPLFVFSILGSLAAVLTRLRRSEGIEQAQLKWLVYTAVVVLMTMLFTFLVLGFENQLSSALFLALPLLLALTMGIAILRYRLFDIDFIIRRTLQYGLLTGILVGIYFGLVITLQALVTAAGGQRSEIFIVLSTLIIAALFNVLRRRIQDVIDRRFYRSKYDAEQALARFAAAARDEVDLEALTAALLATVNETMRPERLSLWLKEQEHHKQENQR